MQLTGRRQEGEGLTEYYISQSVNEEGEVDVATFTTKNEHIFQLAIYS